MRDALEVKLRAACAGALAAADAAAANMFTLLICNGRGAGGRGARLEGDDAARQWWSSFADNRIRASSFVILSLCKCSTASEADVCLILCAGYHRTEKPRRVRLMAGFGRRATFMHDPHT